MHFSTLLLLPLALSMPLAMPLAMGAEDSFHAQPTGAFTRDGLTCGLLLQGPGLIATSAQVKPEDGWPKRDGSTWETRGSIAAPDGAVVHLVERLVARPDGGLDLDLHLDSTAAVPADTVALVIDLPATDFAGRGLTYNDGEAVPLPRDAGEGMLSAHWKSGISAIAIPLGDHSVVLRGTLDSGVADERAWGQPRFGLRLFCDRPDRTSLSAATLRLSIGAAKQ